VFFKYFFVSSRCAHEAKRNAVLPRRSQIYLQTERDKLNDGRTAKVASDAPDIDDQSGPSAGLGAQDLGSPSSLSSRCQRKTHCNRNRAKTLSTLLSDQSASDNKCTP
jgi:hypothetical protein